MTKKPDDDMSAQTETATAYHEAGHAVAAYRLGLQLLDTSIKHNNERGILGISISEGEWADGSTDTEQIITLYAGYAAEKKYNPDADESGSESDNEKAAYLLRCTDETEDNLRQRVNTLINENWHIIHKIVEKLLMYKTLRDEELLIIIDAFDEGEDPDEMFDQLRQMRAAFNKWRAK